MQELAILAVLELLVTFGLPAIAKKEICRNGDGVIVGLTLDSRYPGAAVRSCVQRFKVGVELQVVAGGAIWVCNHCTLSLDGSHATAKAGRHLGCLVGVVLLAESRRLAAKASLAYDT